MSAVLRLFCELQVRTAFHGESHQPTAPVVPMRSSYIGQGRDERVAHGEAERNHPLTHNTHTTRVRAGGHKQRTEPRELRRSCVRPTPRGVGVRVLNGPSELLGKRQQVRNGAGAKRQRAASRPRRKDERPRGGSTGRARDCHREELEQPRANTSSQARNAWLSYGCGAASERSSSSHMRTLASTRATRGSRRRHKRNEPPRAGRAALDEGGHSGRRLALTSPHRQRRTPRVAPNPLLQ